MADGKISVEAEQSGPNEVTLTVKDMALRRRINDKLGRHNATLSHAKLKRIGFPPGSIRDLEEGRPVRFRMNPAGYMSLLGVAADALALGGFDDGGLNGRDDPPSEIKRVADALRKSARQAGLGVEIQVAPYDYDWIVGDPNEVFLTRTSDGWLYGPPYADAGDESVPYSEIIREAKEWYQ